MQQTSVRYQKGVGPKLAGILARLGVETVIDLIYYFPRQYQDRTHPAKISKLQMGQDALIKAKIVKVSASRTKRNFSIFKAQIKDDSGSINALWFNQPFLVRVLKPGIELFLFGKLELDSYSGQAIFVPRDYEVINASSISDPIVPIYPLTEGMTQKMLRRLIKPALEQNIDSIEDHLPRHIKEKFRLPELKSSIRTMHFPKDINETEAARRRLAFDEFLAFQFGLLYNRKMVEDNTGISFDVEGELIGNFRKNLPFELTNAQQKVLGEILNDMKRKKVMNRLLQGDVGSGKTIVAIYAMVVAVQSGYQAAIMAPTEILANQHFHKITEMLDGLNINIVLLTGSERKGRKEVLKGLKDGKPLIIIGTHALLEEEVIFGKLGFIVIDEQHRFGVGQRLKLRQKSQKLDLLVMTATPIPRTLALTLYGDLDRSVIDEMPPGRTKIVTRYIREAERQKLYEFIRAQITKGRQAYVVCPLIEESEKLDMKAAEQEEKALANIFPEFKVGLIHGRMKGAEKDSIMTDFLGGKIKILVSTTVIEVGVDVPNSSLMLIEHCERFGLSQLHQLRGRVGRGRDQSYCFLGGDAKSDTAKKRIEAMLKTTNGFEIAEEDLKLRGPGEFFGASQWGLPNFRVADIIRDEDILKEAREAALMLLDEGHDISRFNLKFWGNNLE